MEKNYKNDFNWQFSPPLLKNISSSRSVLRIRIRIRWIRKILASWIRIRKNMQIHDPDPRGKILTKNCKKKKNFLLLNPNSELLKKERL